MKSSTIKLVLAALIACYNPIQIKAIDAVLAGAVTGQTMALKGVYKERTKKQEAIIKAETAITVALTEIHKVENKVLEYLSNAQGAMTNLYQIKRAAELSAIEIPNNIKLVGKSIPNHLRGTAIALIVSDEIKDAVAEATSLYPLVAQLVTSGSYNVTDIDGDTKKKKVNLLDAAERYYIANEIVTRLENINMSLYLLAWQIRTYTLSDLFFHLTPDTWYNVMAGDAIVRAIIREYSYL